MRRMRDAIKEKVLPGEEEYDRATCRPISSYTYITHKSGNMTKMKNTKKTPYILNRVNKSLPDIYILLK